MNHEIQFGQGSRALPCEVCESMCLDAVDGTLTAAEEAAFTLHVAGCTACAEQWAEAQRGAAWMEMLKAHKPEPSSALLANILARTIGGNASAEAATEAAELSHLTSISELQAEALSLSSLRVLPSPTTPQVLAGGRPGKVLAFRQRMAATVSFGGGQQAYMQPRLLMTAAMAFFSIALTMNLAGIRPSDLRPGALHRTVADAGATAVRSFQGIGVVYQVESKVSELRQDQHSEDAPHGAEGSLNHD